LPRKVRQLKADLRRAGFVLAPSRGKGSHTVWEHPLVPDDLTLAGHDGDDAKPYQERDVRSFIERARRAEQGMEP
jgi:predicted RNA binding protein YcfA (HicA-like mRNA interferase family)